MAKRHQRVRPSRKGGIRTILVEKAVRISRHPLPEFGARGVQPAGQRIGHGPGILAQHATFALASEHGGGAGWTVVGEDRCTGVEGLKDGRGPSLVTACQDQGISVAQRLGNVGIEAMNVQKCLSRAGVHCRLQFRHFRSVAGDMQVEGHCPGEQEACHRKRFFPLLLAGDASGEQKGQPAAAATRGERAGAAR
ncbi:MAG TPA: hypothetical protein DCY47_04425 [Candidatus Accumulibacter sp.]|nr:hypothetical protein [Accumulibacter sp.]